MNDDNTTKLWRWFYQNDERLRAVINPEVETDMADQEAMIESLNDLVLELGPFGWEIEAGTKKEWAFIMTPNEDSDLLEISKACIAEAPELPNWEYYACKPAKIWDREFTVWDNDGNPIDVSAASWTYVAVQDEEGIIDLYFKADNLNVLDEEDAFIAVNFIATSELGEEVKMKYVNSVEIVSDFGEENADAETDIQHLSDHVAQMIEA